MNKKISVLLSSSINFTNSGMFSVDYAAYKFFTENYPNCDLSFYVFHLSDKSTYPYQHLMPYEIYNVVSHENLSQLYKSDLIVFWSDFFHTKHFYDEFLHGYVFSHDVFEREKQVDLFFKTFFLESAPKHVMNKAITFGNSMMFLDTDSLQNDRYANALKTLYSNIRMSMPRDIVSGSKIKRLAENCNVCCDPAFLLGFDDKQPKTTKKPIIGLYIGRRCEIRIFDLLKIILFSKMKGAEIEWIDWMLDYDGIKQRALDHKEQRKNLMIQYFLARTFRRKKTNSELANHFSSLRKFDFIITDTYHLAINGIRNFVSVFCIGYDSIIYNKNAMDLHDKKKEVLFKQINRIESYGKPTFSKLNNAFKANNILSHVYSVTKSKNMLISVCNDILGG